MATIHTGTDEEIHLLAQALRQDELVAVPTETVYGLAGNGLSKTACGKIFAAKDRPFSDPLILHVPTLEAAEQVAAFSPQARRIAETFWPGPLTLVLPKKAIVPDIVTSGGASVAVRIPQHPLFRRLLETVGLPLAAPSANPFGYVSPTTADHVQAGLGNRIDHILDGGPCPVGVESTILDLRVPEEPRLLRPGGIPVEELEAVLGIPVRLNGTSAAIKVGQAAPAPGMLERHYSPHTPVRLRSKAFDSTELKSLPPTTAALCWQNPGTNSGPNIFWLSETGEPGEAASRLFTLLRQLDNAGFSLIEAETAPESGLGRAINDRLRRAAARTAGQSGHAKTAQ